MVDIYGANPVDIVVLVILLVSGLLALVRGFVSEILTLAGLIAAVVAALYGIPYIEPHLVPYVKGFSEKEETVRLLAQGASALVLFFGTLAVASIVTYFISRRIHKTNLSAVDRSLGFLFGLLRGALIVTLLYIAVTAVFPPPKPGEDIEPGSMQAVLREARSGPALDAMARLLVSFAPEKGLTIEDLTKLDPIQGLIQPQPEQRQTHSDEERGYGEPARNGLNDVINRATRPDDATP